MFDRKFLHRCALILALAVISSLSPTAQAAKTPRLKSAAGREDSVTNTILSGRGAPRTSLGVEGDFYIDVTTFTIYGPKKASKWPTGVSLKGPQGEDGKSGERGAAGSSGNGAKGEKGDRGEKGEKGDKGETGERGATGAVGATGPAGSQGSTGAQGPAGPAGVAGSPGATGATGSQGAQGLQGLKGDTGDQGPAGPQGPQGAKGDVGPSEISVGAISFLSSVVGSAGQIAQSETFGTLSSGKSYQVDLTVYGVGVSDTENLPLKLTVLGVGTAVTIDNVQWINTSSRSYRSGQVVFEHAIMARFAINRTISDLGYSLQVQVTTGDTIMNDRPVSFTGSYLIQLVGSVK